MSVFRLHIWHRSKATKRGVACAVGFGSIVGGVGCVSSGNVSSIHTWLSDGELERRVVRKIPLGTPRAVAAERLRDLSLLAQERDRRMRVSVDAPWWEFYVFLSLSPMGRALVKIGECDQVTGVRWLRPEEQP